MSNALGWWVFLGAVGVATLIVVGGAIGDQGDGQVRKLAKELSGGVITAMALFFIVGYPAWNILRAVF